MERMTQRNEAGLAEAREGFSQQELLERLAKFEEFYEGLEQSQEELAQKLAKLRAENQTKSYKFRELMGKKLMQNEMLIAMKYAGLE